MFFDSATKSISSARDFASSGRIFQQFWTFHKVSHFIQKEKKPYGRSASTVLPQYYLTDGMNLTEFHMNSLLVPDWVLFKVKS